MLTRAALATALVLSVSVLASAQTRVLTTIPAGVMTVSDWYRQSVYDPMDKKIGTINDVLITKDGKVEVLIVGVGGFVGVGTKDVAVAPAAVNMTTKNNKAYLVMNSTKDELKAAPGFKFDRTSRTWVPADTTPPPNKKK
jgi:hypothetical protein